MANDTILARLQEALTEAESTGTRLEIDEIAWLIGNFPTTHWLRGYFEDSASQPLQCPRVKALLPQMEQLGSATHALIYVVDKMNDENIVGRVAELIRKLVHP